MIQNDLADTWIETKSENGKCYYYNAKTRETTWNKPDNAKILSQEQFLQNTLSSANNTQIVNQQNSSNDKGRTYFFLFWKLFHLNFVSRFHSGKTSGSGGSQSVPPWCESLARGR